jgi:ATP-dependent Lhr-like helicase
MRGRGIDVFVHHSSVSLEERRQAEERFHHGTNACIVATSTLELGIDVGDLDLVFQANAPSTVSSFLQRLGRTGRRAGQVANTTFLCENAEAVLQAVALVELAREGWVEEVPVLERCWPVLVHQLFALALQFGGISVEAAWARLACVPDFRGIARAEYEALVEHLLREEYLFEAGGLLSLGRKAEREFGRRNFMALYAVFSSPAAYKVQTGAETQIGTLEQDFVDRLVEQMSSFLLGGRAWTVEAVRHSERVVQVRPAPRGQQPSWSGFAPQMLSRALCQRIRQVLEEDTPYPYLHPTAQPVLESLREDMGPLLRRSRWAVQLEEGVARWWTYAGGRANTTLKHALEEVTGWRVMADNVRLRIEGAGVSHLSLRETVEKLASPAQWEDGLLWRRIQARLPEYRLSKFQATLPERPAQELLAGHLLDLTETRRFLSDVLVVQGNTYSPMRKP